MRLVGNSGLKNSSEPYLQHLLGFPPGFFAVAFSRQGGLDTLFLARFQIERMFLYFFNDVLLLDLPFEAAKGVFERLTLLNSDFRQPKHPLTV